MKQISRHGSYAIIVHHSKILLTKTRSGPYKGLWSLPGGGIEFGETPEATLKRELLEECALSISNFEFSSTATSTVNYNKNGISYEFHQVGLLYKVLAWETQPLLVPQEENLWVALSDINQEKLTPLALYAISNLPQNNSWRPFDRIRGKAIGLVKHENRLLVCEVLDDEGAVKGWCPLGGGIEFGERAEDALKREIYEELGCDCTITGDSIICENIFEHHGNKGHEIIFAFPIKLSNTAIYTKERFQIYEDKGSSHWVEWVPIECFERGKALLFPSLLLTKLIPQT